MVVQAPLKAVGFVVAGGLSTRMGRDKALLPWGGSTLLDHAIARVGAACSDVRILCGPVARYEDRGLPLVLDPRPDRPSPPRGPLAALAAGLDSAGDAPGLYLAVDLPHVTVALLAALLAIDDDDGHRADAIVPVTSDGPQPLCAVYRRGCLPAVRARLSAGQHRMTSFWPDVRVRTVDAETLSAFGDPGRLFHNVNAPGDHPPAREPA